ncbi:MAG: GH36-type glycosyl hydrolase domain-containing protein [Sedimentisphaeraceae bacterium JB056]
MEFKNKWGCFSDNGRAFVINDPATPQPWENYLYSFDGKFIVEITQRGEGLTHFMSPEANKVSFGRNYCIKDFDSGRCFSLNAGAGADKAQDYKCTHRPGRTVFQVSDSGIKTNLTIFVDPDSHTEINRLEITNNGPDRKISLIGYHKGQFEGISNFNQLERSVYLDDIGALLVKKYGSETPDYKYSGFYLSDIKADSFCGDNDSLFSFDAPESQAKLWDDAILPNKHASATTLIEALQHKLEIKQGQTIVINYAFGIADDLDDAEEIARRFSKINFDAILQKNISFYDELISSNTVSTPDDTINYMTNVWIKTQLHKQVISDRGISIAHNWRNNMLDCWGYLPFNPDRAHYYLKTVCSLAKADGHMARTSSRIPELLKGDYIEFFMNARYSDISSWVGIAAGRYAAETGDIDFFKTTVEYANGEKSASIIQCIINGIDWILQRRGRHGLVLVLDGDWCDPLNNIGKKGIGESPWTSVALVRAIKALNPLLDELGMFDVSERFTQASRELADAVNTHAWDGQWYIRAITDDGERFCSSDDGHVSLMMQAWPLIAGVVPEDRKEILLKSIDKYLVTELGPLLYGPPFETPLPHIGRVTAKEPGTGENGSVYVHGATMLANGFFAAGASQSALEMIKSVLPMRDNPDDVEITKAVPLWFPNFWHGPRSAAAGRTSNIVGTGAAATLVTNVFEGFMGIKPHVNYLEVSPCMPVDWDNVGFIRKWRGATYKFNYSRVEEIEDVALVVNGQPFEGNKLPIPTGNVTVDVLVQMPFVDLGEKFETSEPLVCSGCV